MKTDFILLSAILIILLSVVVAGVNFVISDAKQCIDSPLVFTVQELEQLNERPVQCSCSIQTIGSIKANNTDAVFTPITEDVSGINI